MSIVGNFAEIDTLAINTIRVLAADMVQKANSGHPGAPMGCAPLAHVLFSRHFKCNPEDPNWPNRDRFVLSNGHACALHYILLHLLGYPVALEDLKQFRQLDSITPGHPENILTPGIEVSTGPLGQGFANAVGMAIAEAHLAATSNRPNYEIIDNYTYVIAGDGCMMEGITSEAASLAGHLKLGKLIVFYDDNEISIDGETSLAFTEDTGKRFEAYGWQVLCVEDGDADLEGIEKVIVEAQRHTSQPTLIRIRTSIGFGSTKQGTDKVHGSPLGESDLNQVKKRLGFNPNEKFIIPEEVAKYYKEFRNRGIKQAAGWKSKFDDYAKAYPDFARDLERRWKKLLPENWRDALPTYTGEEPPEATRKLSQAAINRLVEVLPEFIGGSADLTPSNCTRAKSAVDFQSPASKHGDYTGNYIRYGVREHGMAAITNGIAAYGGFIPFAATFLVFMGYALGAVRLSALSQHHVLYITTHDSIGLGEDGPTHQPIETLASLRAIPGLDVWRPADGNEVTAAYTAAIAVQHPSVLSLTRQNVPHFPGSSVTLALNGGYIIHTSADITKIPQLILVSTGSEVGLCVETACLLWGESQIPTRVVSLPCWERFDQQSVEYRRSVLLPRVPTISVEALSMMGWKKYAHVNIGMSTFGASGPYKEVYAKFGFTPKIIADKARSAWAYYQDNPVPDLSLEPHLS